MKYIFLAVCVLSFGCVTGCFEKKHPRLETENVRLEDDEVEREVSKFKADVHALLCAEKYEELDKLAETNLVNRQLFGDGEWVIRVLNEGLFEPELSNESEWDLLEKKMKAWIAQCPQSVSARAAYVGCLTRRAWFYRGNKWASEVREDAWPKFEKYLKLARHEFEEALNLPQKSPELYSRGIMVACGLGLPKSYAYKLFLEGKRQFPTYFSLYRLMGYFLMPRWHGKPGELEDFLRTETADIGFDGPSVYAAAVVHFDEFHDNIYKECAFDWNLASAGFEQLVGQYPKSRRLLNAYALHCVEAGQREKAKELFDKIGPTGNLSVWGKQGWFAKNRNWAYGNIKAH